ncbi:hypothetical protein ACIGG9_11650 [Pseudonocardia alni]|uniref:hypothetical protein n=1 Tax=Pseudonocardia alni TaxID=33907 RepID=UPI0033C39F32
MINLGRVPPRTQGKADGIRARILSKKYLPGYHLLEFIVIDNIASYASLGEAGRSFYEQLDSDLDIEIGPAEELMILEACALVDSIRELEDAKSRGLWIPGRQGDVLNPAYAELRQHRGQLMTLLQKLGLLADNRGAHMKGNADQARRNALGRNK